MIICFTTFPLCPHPLVWFIFIWAPIITHGYVLISKLYVYSPCVRCMCCGARFAATFLTACEWIRRIFQHSLFRSSGLFDAWALFWPPTSCFVYTCLLIVIWFSLYCLCISCYIVISTMFLFKSIQSTSCGWLRCYCLFRSDYKQSWAEQSSTSGIVIFCVDYRENRWECRKAHLFLPFSSALPQISLITLIIFLHHFTDDVVLSFRLEKHLKGIWLLDSEVFFVWIQQIG